MAERFEYRVVCTQNDGFGDKYSAKYEARVDAELALRRDHRGHLRDARIERRSVSDWEQIDG